MNTIKRFLCAGILLMSSYLNLQAQADFCLSLENETLTVNLLSQADYNTAPNNFWNSTVFTIRYPTTATVAWSGFTESTALSLGEDLSTIPAIDGGDGYYYKMFSSADVGAVQNFATGSSTALFSINFTSDQTVTFELVNSNTWTTNNNGDLTFNNAVSNNIVNTVVTTCGTQTYTVAAAIVDNDNDGVLSDTDPNDSDPCVPVACPTPCPSLCLKITAIR